MGFNSMLGAMGSDSAYKRLFRQVMKNYNDEFIKVDEKTIDFDNLKAEPLTIPEKKSSNTPAKTSESLALQNNCCIWR